MRNYNFCAGPSALPTEVLEELKEEILDWFKKKITFWKKENFKNHSSWVESE